MFNDHQHHDVTRHAALMVKSRRFWLIWLIPAAAIVAAGYLGWRSYVNTGPMITISFESAAGIEAGKTQIKHKDIVMGLVEKVEPTPDLLRVVVTARMGKAAEPYLTRDARFWVVRPSLSSKDLSGLGTLISGSYLQFAPGRQDNDSERDYTGEESPDFLPADAPGETYTLHTDKLGSIGQGTPVLYHGTAVGEILGYALSDKDGSATLRVFVHAPHQALVHTGTRFWNTSGISVIVGSAGLKVRMDSVQSLLTGGIEFDVPPNIDAGPVAKPDSAFTLYADESSAEDAGYTKRIRFLLHFADPSPGLVVGSPVRMQGLTVGQVVDTHIEYDSHTGALSVPTIIEVEADRLKLLNSAPDTLDQDAYDAFRVLVHSGMRASLGSGNLLTGQKVVDLNVMQGLRPMAMLEGGDYPEIPTTEGSDMDAIMRKVEKTVAQVNKVIGSPEFMDSVRSLDASLKETAQAISSDQNGGDLAGTLRELKDAARSVRVLTDYLENHPESLIEGKKENK